MLYMYIALSLIEYGIKDRVYNIIKYIILITILKNRSESRPSSSLYGFGPRYIYIIAVCVPFEKQT